MEYFFSVSFKYLLPNAIGFISPLSVLFLPKCDTETGFTRICRHHISV